MSLKVPNNLLTWLTDKTSEGVEMIPANVKKDPVNKLTTYLLNESSEDFNEILLEVSGLFSL